MTTEEIQAILHEMGKASGVMLCVTGGEPFVREDIRDILRTASSAKILVFVASNGTLVDDAFASELSGHVAGVRISIDGSSAKIHDGIRGRRGCFQAALRAISCLKSKGIKTGVETVVMRSNLNCVPEIGELVGQMGVDWWEVSPLFPTGRAAMNLSGLRVSRREYGRLASTLRSSAGPKKRIHLWRTCNSTEGAGELGCIVLPDGDVVASENVPIVLGNVKQESLGTIWKRRELLDEPEVKPYIAGLHGRKGFVRAYDSLFCNNTHRKIYLHSIVREI